MSISKKTLTGVGAIAALLLLLYLFVNLPSGPEHHQPPLRFADSESAAAHANRQPAPLPDYHQYQDLAIPPLSPEEALKTFQIEDGFRIELVAHEPAIIDPVAMDIDPDGRLWVVEMQSYMPVHDHGDEETSELERVPQSRIVVLEDSNGDGFMDKSHVFMDNLILPRAIKVLESGVLFAEPPNVWLIRDTTGNGIGDTKEVIYSSYGNPDSDNVEHMPNGLMWGMDNWLHSAHNRVESLRFLDGEWQTRPFEQLQQWGMTQDDWGNLYSTHNTRTLTTHLSPYGYSDRHPEFRVQHGTFANIAESERMWPAHPTGVNRGYRINNEVNEDGFLIRSTSTTGPVIYRGDQFGSEYQGNAFVPEPAGNLVKRLVGIHESPGTIERTARFAYEGREFLTSTDERFRPVNMYNAPDGSLYLIDFYRGLFQHARFLTEHLREYSVEHDLHLPDGYGQFGRIYRIVREDREIQYQTPRLRHLSPSELTEMLDHPNGLLRDQAQQLLVQRSPEEAIPLLESIVTDGDKSDVSRLHALWTLEGYDRMIYPESALAPLAMSALDDSHPRIRAAAIRILEPQLRQNDPATLDRMERMVREETDEYPRLQLLASLGESDSPDALSMISDLLDREFDNPYFREMALTGVYLRERDRAEMLSSRHDWNRGENEYKDELLDLLEEAALLSPTLPQDLSRDDAEHFESGAQLYRTCAVCHGDQGEGVAGVATPLAGSEYASGPADNLIRITLHGFESDAEVMEGVSYGQMPAHRFLPDEEVAAILTYIRLSWGNSGAPVPESRVREIRQMTDSRNTPWSPEELQELE